MEQLDMFANDPSMKMRDSKGRFATPERARADKAIEENKMLRLQVEKYRRAYLAAGEMSAMYHRELVKVKEELKQLLRKQKEHEQSISEEKGKSSPELVQPSIPKQRVFRTVGP